jgi:hypothetical protein
MRETEWVPVTEILQNVTYSCDFDYISTYIDSYGEEDGYLYFWNEVISTKASDSGFGYLVESIIENGFNPKGAIGYDRHTGEINEGHHRLVAAILLCLDEVPVTPYGECWYENGENVVTAHEGYHHVRYPIQVEIW